MKITDNKKYNDDNNDDDSDDADDDADDNNDNNSDKIIMKTTATISISNDDNYATTVIIMGQRWDWLARCQYTVTG